MTAYILKSSLSLIVFFGLYWFLLRKEKLFVFNRFFLIGSLILSLLVPLISISVDLPITPHLIDIVPTNSYALPEISTVDNFEPRDLIISKQVVDNSPITISLSTIILFIYISGVLLFLIRFLWNISSLIRLSKLSEKVIFKGYRILLTDYKTDPCCFFNTVILNRNEYINQKIDKEVVDHELEHVRQFHSIDIMLIEIIKIFYWFNPIHVLYNRAIRINHEYLADNGVIVENPDIESYADKLLNFIALRNNISLTSGSKHSFIKMRLVMITKSRSGSFRYATKIATSLCLGAILFFLISCKESQKLTSNTELPFEPTKDKLNEKTETVATLNGSENHWLRWNGHFPPQDYLIESMEFKSKILKSNRKALIFRPKTINVNDSIKILYLLDGDFTPERFQKVRNRLKDYDSEFIAVGIINTGAESDRFFTKDADIYLTFLSNELIPLVEQDYTRVTRILFGHSKAAAFTIYTYINKFNFFSSYHVVNPSTFSNFIKRENVKQTKTPNSTIPELNVFSIDKSQSTEREFRKLKNFMSETRHIDIQYAISSASNGIYTLDY